LKNFCGFVHDSGESRWTAEAAIKEAGSADVITAAMFARFRSRQDHTFGEKMLSAVLFFAVQSDAHGPITTGRLFRADHR
jgi:6-phosphogluconate dehydrogenase